MMFYKSSEQALLLQQVSRQLATLEDAIAKINSTRNQLKHRSLEVKSEIQTTVTRQLEALREREVYLLHQVDLIQQAKDAALQGQEDKLHQALGSLTTSLQVAETGQRTYSLADAMQKLKNLNMNPNETPNLSFRADLAQANDAINNFGQIDTQGLPFDGLFGQEASSTSLPRAFEDYDDEEHHVLYKSLSDTSTIVNKKEISVAIPRMSRQPEDWLFMPTENLAPVKLSTSAGHFQFPPFMSSNVQQFMGKHDGMTRSMSSAASIQQWLCDIQGQADVEEDEADFEVISPPASFVPASTKGSSIEILSMDEASPASSMGAVQQTFPSLVTPSFTPLTIQAHTTLLQTSTLPYFNQVLSDPATNWLLAATQESSPAYCHEILSYFREISSDTKHWLQYYSDKKQKEECQDICAKGASCTAKPQTLDIENLAQLTCMQDVTSDPHCWLVSRKDEDVDVDETEIEQEVGALCKANEPCLSLTDCVSENNCYSTVVENDVVKEDVEGGGDIGAYFCAVVEQSSNIWLLPTDADDNVVGSVSNVTSDSFPPEFTHNCNFPAFSNPTWLTCDQSQSEPRASLCNFTYFSEVPMISADVWLAPVSASMDNTTAMEDIWKSLFSHQLPSSPTHKLTKPGYFDNNCLTLDQQPLSEWLSPLKSYIPNITSTKSDWLFTTSNTDNCKPFSEPTMKESWLTKSEFISHLEHENSKELQNMENKNMELPECFDEGKGDKCANVASMFEYFKREEQDNRNWLCNDNLLVE